MISDNIIEEHIHVRCKRCKIMTTVTTIITSLRHPTFEASGFGVTLSWEIGWVLNSGIEFLAVG